MRLQALQACMAPWQQLVRCVRHHRHAACRRVLCSWAAYCRLLDAFFARVKLLLLLALCMETLACQIARRVAHAEYPDEVCVMGVRWASAWRPRSQPSCAASPCCASFGRWAPQRLPQAST